MKKMILLAGLLASFTAEAVSFRLIERTLSRPHSMDEQSQMEKALYGKAYRTLYDYCNAEGKRLQVASGLMVEMDFQIQNFKTKTDSVQQSDQNQKYITSGTLYAVCWLKYI